MRRARLELLQTMGPPCQIHPAENFSRKSQYEGGNLDTTQNKLLGKKKKAPLVEADEVNPFHFLQHPNLLPRKRDHKIPDHRVFNTFQRGVRFDMLFLRNIIILGNFAVIVLELS